MKVEMQKFDQKKLFFIIAPDRSGTTLLQNIMNTFSNFCNVQESRIAGPGSQSCWDYVIKHNDFSYLEKFLRKKWTSEFFVEKSPPSINCMPQIRKKFPDANFIFLRRDPNKIILSQLNLHFGLSEIGYRKADLGNLLLKPNSVPLKRERIMAKRLLKMIRNQMKYKHIFQNKFEIRYEDLVNSLDEQINLLGNHFGINPNHKNAQKILSYPTSSATFRYGIKDLSDKIAKDIIKTTCKLWDYI